MTGVGKASTKLNQKWKWDRNNLTACVNALIHYARMMESTQVARAFFFSFPHISLPHLHLIFILLLLMSRLGVLCKIRLKFLRRSARTEPNTRRCHTRRASSTSPLPLLVTFHSLFIHVCPTLQGWIHCGNRHGGHNVINEGGNHCRHWRYHRGTRTSRLTWRLHYQPQLFDQG